MATRTTNFNLYKPDATDPLSDFRAEFNDSMDAIDANLGGGGSKHTIVDENGQAMPNRTYLEFTGGVQVTDDAGNNKTVVDVQGGGGGSSSLAGLTDVDLTTPTDGQVLSYDGNNSKWVNGAVVFLSEYASAVYSNTEREVGCWTDGKPIYQTTVHINALPNASQIGQYVDYPHGIADIETICYYECITHYPTNVYGNTIKTPRVTFSTSGFNNQSSMDAYCNYTNIRIEVGQDRSNANADFTIWYTKTTDAPGSGKLVPSALPAVHYSESEEIIGTWIDSKPIYQKTVKFLNQALVLGDNYLNLGIANIESIVDCKAFITNSAHTTIRPINSWGQNAGAQILYIITPSAGTFDIVTASAWTSPNIFITLQYTKTTD